MPKYIHERLRTNEWLRTNVFPTPLESEVLLDKLRFGADMTDIERQGVWLLLSDTCYCRAKKHYGMTQTSGHYTENRVRNWHEMPPPHSFYANRNYATHTERMLLLVEFLKSRLDRSSAWCVVAWKRRFAQFEELMHLRQMGISIPIDKVQSKEVRAAVFFRRILRESNCTYAGIYETVRKSWAAEEVAKGKKVTPKREQNFFDRWQSYDTLMSQTKYARSYEQMSETNTV